MATPDEQILIEIEFQNGVVKTLKQIERQSEKSADKVERSFKKTSSGLSSAFDDLGRRIVRLAGPLAAFFGGRAILNAAQRQEDAVNRLNQSLRAAGRFSEQASDQLQRFAQSIQETTRFGDEAVLEQLTLANAFARNNAEAQKLTQAALELSSALGISVESATRNLGKSFSGLLGELSDIVPELRQLDAEALRSGAALDFVLQRFGGSAQADINTFSGTIDQATNSIGDLAEELGFFVTESESSLSLIGAFSDAVRSITRDIRQFRVEVSGTELERVRSEIDQTINEIQKLGPAIDDLTKEVAKGPGVLGDFNVFFIRAAARLQNFKNRADELSGRNLPNLLKEFADLGGGNLFPDADQNQIIDAIAPDPQKIQERQAKILEIVRATNTEILNQQIADANISGELEESVRLQKLVAADQFNQKLLELNRQFNADSVAVGSEGERLLGEARSALRTKFLQQLAAIEAKADTQRLAQVQKVTTAVQGVLVSGISAGVQQLGAALQQGVDAGDAFKNALLSIFGDLLIAIGTQVVATSKVIATLAAALANPFSAPVALAAGLALIAAGGFLKSAAGGGGQGPTIPTTPAFSGVQIAPETGTTVSPESPDSSQVTDDQVTSDPSTQVVVNVQGDILDGEETGLRIVDVLNSAFDTQGVQVKRGVFA